MGVRRRNRRFLRGRISFADFDEMLTRDQLRFNAESAMKRYVYAEKSGHSVPFEQPELIGKEVLWVLEFAMGK